MVGTMINPAQVGGTTVHPDQMPGLSKLNTTRINIVLERLAGHVCGKIKNDPHEFCNLCLALTRGIDFAIANSEVPDITHALPFLLKQVCQQRNDCSLLAAIMVLMISVKNACKVGWFSANDSEELLKLANEMGRSFCTVSDINTEPSTSLAIISRIMSRFYPQMKLGQILAFLEAKPGYGTFMVDFHISRNEKSATDDNIRLFVAQSDNIETSSCIISPPQVNFLLNGKGVDKRTNVSMETGPQIPTVVSHLLKYGGNILQAVGLFNGNYIILVAYMSVVVDPDPPVLDDYVQPANAARDSDPEIVEGASRISLNCPISFRRIKTPVKGHSCNHLQCFDLDNFLDINSRTPKWRCPHCNQYMCYADIRVDQYMVKVLREVGENVVDVLISGDGSWKAVTESNDQTDQPCDETGHCLLDEPVQEPARFSETVPDVVDLTRGNDDETYQQQQVTLETEDRKPFQASLETRANVASPTVLTNEGNQNIPASEDDFWSGLNLPTFGSSVSGGRSNIQLAGGVGVTEPASTDWMLTSVLTGSGSPSLNREPEAFHPSTHRATSVHQQNLHQFVNAINSNEYGRFPSVARHVNRTPIAVQALPAQTQPLTPQQRSRNSLNGNNMIPNGSLPASPSIPSQSSVGNGFGAVPSNMEQQQQFSRVHNQYPLQGSRLISSSQQNIATQNHSNPGQQLLGLPSPNQLTGSYRVSPAHQQTLHQHQQQQQQRPLTPIMSRPMSRTPPSMIRSAPPSAAQSSSSYYSQQQTPVHLGGGGGFQSGAGAGTASQQHARMVMAAAARQQSPVPTQSPRTFSSAAMNNLESFMSPVGGGGSNLGGGGGSSVQQQQQQQVGTDNSDLTAAEQNWQPTSRMRGSLSGRAYQEFSQYIIRPSPSPPVQAAAARPPPSSSQLHVLMANSRNAHASSTQPLNSNITLTEPGGGNNMAGGGSSFRPGSGPEPSPR